MEKKQGFFSALRGLSPSRSRARSRSVSPARSSSPMKALSWGKKNSSGGGYCLSQPELSIGRSGSLRPVMEGPDPDEEGGVGGGGEGNVGDSKRLGSGLGHWVKGQLSRAPSVAATAVCRRNDLRLLLGVMGAPLAPIHVSSSDPLPHLSIKNTPIETSSAQYILQQYTAASGGQKLQSSVKNAYAMGKLKMITSELETASRTVRNRNPSKAESGGFVLWQMDPDMWYVELSVGGNKVRAGCNGKLVWRHTPWLGSHSAKGPVRPLRRGLQGLDPRTTAAMFAEAKCIGEKNVNGEDCFILKLCTDPETLKARSEGPAEIIRHVLSGYFSQKTGLLVHIEDSHLTRIQSNGGDTVFWETTYNSSLDDYRQVEGIMIAHSGHSVVTLFRFGEEAMSHTRTKMEESWTIEEVAFNVPGLSLDCFIPPADLKTGSGTEYPVLPQQCEETILEKNLTEVVNVPETRSILDKDALNENPKASSLANLRSEAVADCQEEDKTAASGRIMTSAPSVSYPADQDAKSSQVLSESVVSESVGYVIRDSASKLVESNSQSDTIPIDKSGTMTDGKECEAFPLKPEESQHLSQDGAPAASLTSAVDLHMVPTSSEANEQVNFSVTGKVSSAEPENCQTVPPVEASNSGGHIVQQPRKQTEDTHQSSQFVEGCPASEGPKDAVDADAAGQVLPQQCEGRILEENLTEVVNVPESQSVLDNDAINENPSASSLAKTATGGIKTVATPVSHPTGGVIEVGVSCASTSSEPFVKSHVTGTENAATDLGSHVISSPARKMTELQLNKTEDQNTLSLMATESPVLDRNPTSSSGLNLTSDTRKAVEISETTLVSPMVVGSLSKSSLEKTAAKSSKTKSERKPRGTPKSAGKETSRKGNSVKGAAPFQHFQSAGKANAVNQSSGSSIQITHSTEKQQSLQTPVLNSFGTLSAPTTSLPEMNSTAPSSIFRRPFTDSQQVQLRAQIFVYGGLIQGTAPDEAYMISAFGGADGGRGTWEKAWRACAVRAQRMRVSSPETPLQSRAGKTETPSMSHTSSKVSSATKPIIPLSSPLWSLSTPLETLQSRSIQRGSAAAPLPSSSHAHQAASVTNIGHNTAWMSPLPYPNPWLASPQTSGFDVGSRFPVFPITESVKLTPTKESSLPYSGGKHVLSGTSGNVFKGTQTLEPASTVVAPAQHSTGTKSRKRKKMPVSVESDPSILNSLQQTEVVVSPLVSISTPVPITAAPGSLSSNAGTLASVDSISAVPINLVSTFPGKKMKSSLQSPIFGGNLVSEVKQRSVLPADTIDKLNEAKMHAEDASALATAAVSHSEYVWKQIEQQRLAGLQPETQGRLASAAVAIAAAAAVAKAAAAAANVAANAAFQAKLMAEEASLPSVSYQGNDLHKSNDVLTQGQGTPASVLKGEGAVVSSSPFLSAAREAAKKRVEAATAATKRAENVESIVKAAELASEAVSQAGILVSMGHPPSLNKLVEVGPSNYWRQAQESEKAQPCKVGVLEKETETTSDRGFASPSTAHTELDGSVRAADGLGLVSATGKKTNGQKGHISADVAKHTAVVFEPEVGSKSSIDTQTESEQIMKKTNDECIKEGSHVEVFKEGPELRTAWYSANVLSLEDGKAYVLFSDLSVEQGTDKLKEWVALKGEGDEAPKIRTARSITALPYEGTRKRRRAAIGDPVWKIGDRVDSWVHDSWLEGVITEKNKNDENTVTVHFPAQGETLTIKAWNLRPSLVWKDGRWIECSTSGENISLSHEGDTPKEKRPRLGAPSPVAEGKDTKMETVVDPDLGKPPQTGVLDLGVSETTFNIGRKEGNPGPLRMKRTGLQTQGAKVIYGVPKPGKTRKFMDVSKHYVSEASNQTRKQKEPAKAVKPIVPQNPGPGSWRLPSKPREKQTTTTTKPKTFKPAPKTKEKPVAAPRIIPRKDSRYTTSSNMESEDAVGQSGENKGPASTSRDPAKGTGEEQITSSSQQGQDTCSQSSTTGKGKVAPTAGRLAKIVEDKASDDNSSKASDGMEPRRSVRRIQPTSRLLEGLQTSMMTSKIPSMSHSRSHQSQRKK